MSTIKERYFDILLRGANLTELCEFTAECVKTPVALTLPTRTIIAKSRDYSETLLTEYTSSRERATPEELKHDAEDIDMKLSRGKAFMRIPFYLRHKRACCGCFWQNRMIAVIDCPIVAGNTFSDENLAIVELAASVFAVALGMNSYMFSNAVLPMRNYLIGLLRGDIIEGYQQRPFYNSILEAVPSWKIIWAKAKDADFVDEMRNHANTVCNQHKNWWWVNYEEGLVILIDATQEAGIAELSEACAGFCVFSVSDSFDETTMTRKHLLLAQQALRFASIERNDSPVIFVDQYKTHIAFLYAQHKSGLDIFENKIINKIKNYDKENSTSYMLTLRSYLHNNKNYNKMAKSLYLHKNTVLYRMKRIEELFHLDLSDIRVLTSLYLSLFIEFGAE